MATESTPPPPSFGGELRSTHAAGAAAGESEGVSGSDEHAVLRFLASLEGALSRIESVPVWSMDVVTECQALISLNRVGSRLEALRLGILAQADRDGAGDASGATGIAAWLAHNTRQNRSTCHAASRLAAELEESFTATGAALRTGTINPEQARVIVDAVNRLTHDHDDLPDDTHAAAEAHLLDLAVQFDAHMLRRLGKRLFEVVCPEATDAAEDERLRKDEERARQRAWFTMHDNGDGTHDGRFTIPDLHAAALKKALEALTSPRRLGDARIDPATGKKIPYPALLGRGLCDLIEHLDPDRLPSQGGSPFTIVVTMTLESLLGRLETAGVLEDGTRISATEARRLACNAGIIPMVLGGDGVPLDLGRERRLFSKHQRIAHAQIYHGCAADNCDRPPEWTEEHHLTPWSRGGRTDLKDGIPLCPPHHHMADHAGQWDMSRLPSGAVRFARRQ